MNDDYVLDIVWPVACLAVVVVVVDEGLRLACGSVGALFVGWRAEIERPTRVVGAVSCPLVGAGAWRRRKARHEPRALALLNEQRRSQSLYFGVFIFIP
jgi:hypothetical protein